MAPWMRGAAEETVLDPFAGCQAGWRSKGRERHLLAGTRTGAGEGSRESVKLVVVVVDPHHRTELRRTLAERSFGATLVESQGGFLGRGSETVLMAVEDQRVDEAISVIRETVHPLEREGEGGRKAVVGTSVFVCPMERFEKR